MYIYNNVESFGSNKASENSSLQKEPGERLAAGQQNRLFFLDAKFADNGIRQPSNEYICQI